MGMHDDETPEPLAEREDARRLRVVGYVPPGERKVRSLAGRKK